MLLEHHLIIKTIKEQLKRKIKRKPDASSSDWKRATLGVSIYFTNILYKLYTNVYTYIL